MKQKIGVWIDLHKAVIITIGGSEEIPETVESGIETRERIPGQKKEFGRFGDQYIDHETKKENRLKNQTDQYLQSLTPKLSSADEIVIFGPADVKNKLESMLQKQSHLKSKIVGVETADSMTENQMIAWTKKYFKESN